MSHKYHSLRGDFFIRPYGTAVPFDYIGNVPEASLALAVETARLESSGNEKGTLATEETSRTSTLSMTLNSLAQASLARVLFGTIKGVGAVASIEFALPAMKAGQMFKIPGVGHITDVVIPEGLTGKYKVLKAGGAIVAVADIPATEGCTAKGVASTAVGVLVGDAAEYEIFYDSENSGKSMTIYRWKPNPAESISLISNEFASLAVSGECLIDTQREADPVLGRIGYIADAA